MSDEPDSDSTLNPVKRVQVRADPLLPRSEATALSVIMTMDDGTRVRRCTAAARSTGERCGRTPIPGGYVCRVHGGDVPAAREAAKQRLLQLVDPAIYGLTQALKIAESFQCKECGGFSDAKMAAVVVKAAQIVLDRAGLGPKKELEVTHRNEAPMGWEQYLSDEQVYTVVAWIKEAQAKAISEGAQLRDEPLESEPIETEATVVEPGNAGNAGENEGE